MLYLYCSLKAEQNKTKKKVRKPSWRDNILGFKKNIYIKGRPGQKETNKSIEGTAQNSERPKLKKQKRNFEFPTPRNYIERNIRVCLVRMRH